MAKFVWMIGAGMVLAVVGILTGSSLAIALGMLGACGLLLFALLHYFETVL